MIKQFSPIEVCPKVSEEKWQKKYPLVDREYVWIYPLIRGEKFDPSSLFQNAIVPLSSLDTAVYIHVPVCLFHCPMCAFYHEIIKDREEISWYADAIIKEVELYSRASVSNSLNLKTIYFGGGTATLLEPEGIGRIIKRICELISHDNFPEITIEGHPLTVDLDYLKVLYVQGVNRVSFGIQSFNADTLKLLGLKQTPKQNYKVLQDALHVGFDTVSMDLMYRMPNQTVKDVDYQLSQAFNTGVTSISAYSLEPSPQQSNLYKIQASEKVDKEMFYLIHDRMSAKNWIHVAQPDYAAPEHVHQELLISWAAPQGQNLSLGAGAWSVFNGATYCNVHNLTEYRRVISENKLPILIGQRMTLEDAISRYPVLGTRSFKIPGIPFQRIFGVNLLNYYSKEIELLTSQGLIESNGKDILVTYKGKYYIDNISKEFYSLENRFHLQPWGGTIAGAVTSEYFCPVTN